MPRITAERALAALASRVGDAVSAGQLALRPLPLEVSPVHVDALWHRRSQQRSAHAWLRQAVVRSAEKAFSASG